MNSFKSREKALYTVHTVSSHGDLIALSVNEKGNCIGEVDQLKFHVESVFFRTFTSCKWGIINDNFPYDAAQV